MTPGSYAEKWLGFKDYIIYKDLADNTCSLIGYLGSDTQITIPDEIDGFRVTEIGERAFKWKSKIESVTIPSSVFRINDYAFSDCMRLNEVKLPGELLFIGDYAFMECGSLNEVVIPSKVTSIGQYAFKESGLVNICIPKSVTSIGTDALIPGYNVLNQNIYYNGTEAEWNAIGYSDRFGARTVVYNSQW